MLESLKVQIHTSYIPYNPIAYDIGPQTKKDARHKRDAVPKIKNAITKNHIHKKQLDDVTAEVSNLEKAATTKLRKFRKDSKVDNDNTGLLYQEL